MSFENFLKRTIWALNKAGLDYVIVGGVAAILYGRPRATFDVDIVINIQPSDTEAVKSLVQAFSSHSLEVFEHKIVSTLKERNYFSVFDTKTPFRVDAKGVYTRLDSMLLKNRKKANLLDLEVWIASPEDMVITKLIYGSPQDIEDVISIILNLKEKLDFEYLNQLAEQEKVKEQLKEIFEKIK